MRILFITPYVPTLIRVRPYNLIRELSRLGHELTLASVWVDEEDLKEGKQLASVVSRVQLVHQPHWRSYFNCIVALPTKSPLQAVYSWNPKLLDQINGELNNKDLKAGFDLVHVEHLRGSRFGLEIKKINPQLPVVWDSVDCISLLFRLASNQSKKFTSRFLTAFELPRTRQYEDWLPRQFDHTLVTSKIDRDAILGVIKRNALDTKVSVLPNGVDLEYFKPSCSQPRESYTLVVSGKMSYHANVTMVLDLVDKIMPHIWAIKPDVKLWIVGKDPAPEIKSLNQKRGVTVTGTVEDIRPYLQQATLAVTPISYGVGIQNKVLEAMACGTPVVSTPQAVSTLNVTHGKDVLIAEHPEEFARHVLYLLDDKKYREQIGEAGRKYVEQNHDWSEIAQKLEEIYFETIKGKKCGGML